MSTQVAPTIPPRPVKASEKAAAQGVSRLPEIPPRPFAKRLDRSVSPGNYPRSPLNEPFNPLSKSRSIDASAQPPLPKRPSVQHLPSVGQEGMEYADVLYVPQQPASALGADAAAQTRNVAEDLHLHAPKPSLPKATATAQVQAVTRTDAQQAAALGIGKPDTPGHDDQPEHDAVGRVRSRASFSRPNSSASAGRRSSVVYGEEQGPAEMGLRVPINPNLGDVQAPSPAPFSPTHTGQNGEHQRRHHRKKSAQYGLPPGSYGLHGHGVTTADPFEKDWYAKHPDELVQEEAHGHGVYEGTGSGRGAFALSSDDLNKIVRNSASRGAGFGTTGNTVSYPDEQIGYLASEGYASRGNSTAPTLTKTLTNASQPALESPLRKSSMPAEDVDPVVLVRHRRSSASNEDAVHVPSPRKKFNKLTGGQETMNETEDMKPYLENSEDDEQGYRVPILASDELAKESGGDYMQPAVAPKFDRRGSAYDYEHRSGDVTPTSRPSSRPGSIYGLHSASHSLSRFISHHDERDTMHTPLEDVDEYEPLFADEDSKQKQLSHTERFKQRPDALKHRFPSQDIWEDAPSSVNYTATVSTPELPQHTEQTEQTEQKPSAVFEPPEAEAARKGEPSEEEKRKLVPAEERLARSKFAPHLRDDMPTRPGMQPRFPSRDIWEDSPDSYHLVATVQTPPPEDASIDEEAQPTLPPRPAGNSRLGDGASSSQIAPSVPARPAKKTHAVPAADAKLTEPNASSKPTSPTDLKKVPSIPERPKPQIPPRPAKKSSGESLSKTFSPESVDSQENEKAAPVISPPVTKVKPQVPARPAANAKFAGLKGNFMNDLNQKLGLGPPKEKEKEPEPEFEAKPLEDARKGRARGPQRRAPAKSLATDTTTETTTAAAPAFSMHKPRSLWHIDETGLLNAGSMEELTQTEDFRTLENDAEAAKEPGAETYAAPASERVETVNHAVAVETAPAIKTEEQAKDDVKSDERPDNAPAPMAPSLATNTAGEYADPMPASPSVEKTNPLSRNSSHASEGAALTQESTESSGTQIDQLLEREVPDPSADAIPASKQTTASTNASGASLERKATNPPEENIELRNEQVSAPAPAPKQQDAAPFNITGSGRANATVTKEQAGQSVAEVGADHAKEPMPEKDVSYAQLEAMQNKADGKIQHEDGEHGPTKIVE